MAEAEAAEPSTTDATKDNDDVSKTKAKLSSKYFETPSWALSTPLKGLHFEVFKQGQYLAKLSIDDQLCLVLGRQPNAVDVVLDHGSISRRHAVIVHGSPHSKDKDSKKDDYVCLIDLNSSHGTYVKEGSHRKRVKPNEPFILTEGVCLEFGESSRSYYVKGIEPSGKTIAEKSSDCNEAATAGAKRKYYEAGYLDTKDDGALPSSGKRVKPKAHWESTAKAFGDTAKHEKFLRLLGGKKKKK
mmetsp:Transcript_13622/g.16274  ORF Transcript_13622/g.16274 Transcript_13622/m.16274 type:complete len:243 (+) Transcript_13622:26-754(+)|eukprot:jgi/Bigna1/86033/estExt_fgenesh1_pg.C_70298